MLGEAFYIQFKNNYEIKCTDNDINENWISFLDFRDFNAYKKDVLGFNPDYLFHLGAYTGNIAVVPDCLEPGLFSRKPFLEELLREL